MSALAPLPLFRLKTARSALKRFQNFGAFLDQTSFAGLDKNALRNTCKALHKQGIQELKTLLLREKSGLKCARAWSFFHDLLLQKLFTYFSESLTQTPPLALLAVGGYGRGKLAPYSDLDLLFLTEDHERSAPLIADILHILWDCGLKIGHSVRTLDECLCYARQDHTILTALLEARFLCGDWKSAEKLFEAYDQTFLSCSRKTSSPLTVPFFFFPFSSTLPDLEKREKMLEMVRQFITIKLQERDERHRRSGYSRYLVEPDVKNSKGGLRDLHTLFWIAHFAFGRSESKSLVKENFFTKAEAKKLLFCEDFLWKVRCHLHFLSQRAEDRLSFSMQAEIATALGYEDENLSRTVERFMHHYFLVAKDVGDLTRIFCSALEARHMKNAPLLSTFANPLVLLTKAPLLAGGPFCLTAGRLNITVPSVFLENPITLLEIFSTAERYNLSIHPDALAKARRSIRSITPAFRQNKEANAIFLEFFLRSRDPEKILRILSETGILGRFVPEFGKIVARMQFDRYHHYTIDEHLLRTVGQVSSLERGDLKRESPLETYLVQLLKLSERKVLYLAAFLHDIAKGQAEVHTMGGKKIAQRLCPRFGFSREETELTSWLVSHHHSMNEVAQTRDLRDPQTIGDFTALVKTPERLKLLLLLTLCDIRAVGPEVWNRWKSELLLTLYHESMRLFSASHHSDSKSLLWEKRQRFVRALQGRSKAWFEHYMSLHEEAYWLSQPLERQVRHAHLIEAYQREEKFIFSSYLEEHTNTVEISFYLKNTSHPLALLAQAAFILSMDIIDASVSVSQEGMSLNTLVIKRRFLNQEEEKKRAERFGNLVEVALKKNEKPSSVMVSKQSVPLPSVESGYVPVIPKHVLIDNSASENTTMIEVVGPDRVGFLKDLTAILSEHDLPIFSAKIATFGEKAIDTFYVLSQEKKKIISLEKQEKLKADLYAIL